MTKNPDGSWTIPGWLVKAGVGGLISFGIVAVGSTVTAIGGFWTFSAEVKSDIAVIKARITDLGDDVEKLSNSVDRIKDR